MASIQQSYVIWSDILASCNSRGIYDPTDCLTCNADFSCLCWNFCFWTFIWSFLSLERVVWCHCNLSSSWAGLCAVFFFFLINVWCCCWVFKNLHADTCTVKSWSQLVKNNSYLVHISMENFFDIKNKADEKFNNNNNKLRKVNHLQPLWTQVGKLPTFLLVSLQFYNANLKQNPITLEFVCLNFQIASLTLWTIDKWLGTTIW